MASLSLPEFDWGPFSGIEEVMDHVNATGCRGSSTRMGSMNFRLVHTCCSSLNCEHDKKYVASLRRVSPRLQAETNDRTIVVASRKQDSVDPLRLQVPGLTFS
jgi:hypothetical protein